MDASETAHPPLLVQKYLAVSPTTYRVSGNLTQIRSTQTSHWEHTQEHGYPECAHLVDTPRAHTPLRVDYRTAQALRVCVQQEGFLARLCKAGGTEGPPTFHRLGPGNVRGLQAPMNEQGAVCQARGQEGLEAQPWERPVST